MEKERIDLENKIKLQEEVMENISGGDGDGFMFTCPNCGKDFTVPDINECIRHILYCKG